MNFLNKRTYEKLYNDHKIYNKGQDKFINELKKISFMEENNFIIHKNIFNKYLNINLVNYFGYSVSVYNNDTLLISKINASLKIKNILESTRMHNNVLCLTFDLIERYMTIITFITYIKQYNPKWLDMCVSYEKKILKINID